jgi:diguanylate cyclase (GGDEF)-like protein
MSAPADAEAGKPAGSFLPEAQAGHLIYTALPFPLCVVDAEGVLVAMNPAAERFWRVRSGDVLGMPVADVLGVRAPRHGPHVHSDPLARALEGESIRIPCQVTTRDGLTHSAAVIGSRLQRGGYTTVAVLITEGVDADVYTDPVTGLPNRLFWRDEQARWQDRSGTVVLFDLDDLKEINDHHGHRAGDRVLGLVGEALRRQRPSGALALRWGGDEFLAVLPLTDAAAAQAFCQGVCSAVAAEGERAVGEAPHLSAGSAPFDPGGFEAALQLADAALYEAKGVLLRAGSGTRLILTREGQKLLRRHTDPPAAPPAAFATRFTTEFDSFFRQAFARASEEARHFVEFVDPAPGCAAVEVGAGSGRITFDGGLAQRIGPTGQLLVADPSEAQLQVAQRRAAEAGCDWVRFVTAPAEQLPLASGCVDLAIGAVFLHFTDPMRAVAEMARVLRRGGVLALNAPLPFPWPPFFADVLLPVRQEAARLGLPEVHAFVDEDAIYAAIEAAGLQVERDEKRADRSSLPDATVARAIWAQGQVVSLMLKGAPAARIQEVEQRVLRRMSTLWDDYPPEERDVDFEYLNVVARKP